MSEDWMRSLVWAIIEAAIVEAAAKSANVQTAALEDITIYWDITSTARSVAIRNACSTPVAVSVILSGSGLEFPLGKNPVFVVPCGLTTFGVASRCSGLPALSAFAGYCWWWEYVAPPESSVQFYVDPVFPPTNASLISGNELLQSKDIGLKWQDAGSHEPSVGLKITHAALESALTSKTEFTQDEWDAFGIPDLHIHSYIKSGGRYFVRIGGPAIDLTEVACWARAPQVLGAQTQLFGDRIEPSDVAQGSLGDCWLLSCIAAVSCQTTAFLPSLPPPPARQYILVGRFAAKQARFVMLVGLFCHVCRSHLTLASLSSPLPMQEDALC